MFSHYSLRAYVYSQNIQLKEAVEDIEGLYAMIEVAAAVACVRFIYFLI